LRAIVISLGLWLAVAEQGKGDTPPAYSSITLEKLVEFSQSALTDDNSDITLRCSACSILATKLEDAFEGKPAVYIEFKGWDRPTRVSKLKKQLMKGCDDILEMKISQTGNRTERIWEDHMALIHRGGSQSKVVHLPSSSRDLYKVCKSYLDVDLPDLVDRMSSYISVVIGKGAKARNQRLVDFKFREEICMKQVKFCGLKPANAAEVEEEDDEEFGWEEDDEKEEL